MNDPSKLQASLSKGSVVKYSHHSLQNTITIKPKGIMSSCSTAYPEVVWKHRLVQQGEENGE